MQKKHGILGTITVYAKGVEATLHNACVNTDCVWHTSNWLRIDANGCYMLADNTECISGEKSGFQTISEAKKEGLI